MIGDAIIVLQKIEGFLLFRKVRFFTLRQIYTRQIYIHRNSSGNFTGGFSLSLEIFEHSLRHQFVCIRMKVVLAFTATFFSVYCPSKIYCEI